MQKLTHKTRPAYRRYHKASRTGGQSAHIFGVYEQSHDHAENAVYASPCASPSRGWILPRKENCTAILQRHSKCRCKTSAPPPRRPARAFLPIILSASPTTLLLRVSMNPSVGTTREFALNHIFYVVSRLGVSNIVRRWRVIIRGCEILSPASPSIYPRLLDNIPVIVASVLFVYVGN